MTVTFGTARDCGQFRKRYPNYAHGHSLGSVYAIGIELLDVHINTMYYDIPFKVLLFNLTIFTGFDDPLNLEIAVIIT